MLEGISGLVTYLALKLFGYTFWCYVGVRCFDPGPGIASKAVLRGLARLVLGWLTGILVAPLAVVAVSADRVPLFYFSALAIVRWFEWGVIQYSFPANASGAGILLHGGSAGGRLWRLSGIAISYLADAPFLIAGGGFPHGRIFC